MEDPYCTQLWAHSADSEDLSSPLCESSCSLISWWQSRSKVWNCHMLWFIISFSSLKESPCFWPKVVLLDLMYLQMGLNLRNRISWWLLRGSDESPWAISCSKHSMPVSGLGQWKGMANGCRLNSLSCYIAELSILEYKALHFLPSMIAASAVFLAQYCLSRALWNPTLEHYSSYSASDLR